MMTLSMVPNDDLQLCDHSVGGLQVWEARGDDPAFKISYPLIRSPIVVISIFATSAPVDPKIYVDRGRGFTERDALSISSGPGFVFILDVGSIGSLRAFRIDPVSFPTRFQCQIMSFEAYEDGKRHARAMIAHRPAAEVIEVGALPRFGWPRIKLPSLRPKQNSAAAYINAHYSLAAREDTPPTSYSGVSWLSIIVPVYNTPTRYLNELLDSFRSQRVDGVELILSDDGSTSPETRAWLEAHRFSHGMRVILNPENGGIAAATNAGLHAAAGDWVTFLDHDDLIAPYALRILAIALNEYKDALFFFSDEVVVDDRLEPKGLMLKPDFDPILLSGVNYINHFSVYRRSRLEEIGFLRIGYDGSQDYDLLLRYLEGIPETAIHHIPYPAYWWRQTGRSYSARYIEKATQNARKAVADSFARIGRRVEVEGAVTKTLHKVEFVDFASAWPKISILIPSRNAIELISRILEGIFVETDYPNYEVIVVDNGSNEESVLALYKSYKERFANFSYDLVCEDFNFSRSVNRGLRLATAEHVLLLNNDIEVIEPEWLKEMVQCLAFERAGIVGAKLLYPNNTIQHAGVIVGFGDLAGHWYSQKPRDFGGPMNRLHVRNSMSCVTGAAMLISGECLKEVGDWDEFNFPIAYNDVDYCLRARKAGYRVIWTPFSCLYHHESVSRGSDVSGARRQRFEKEKERLRAIHATKGYRDPTINPGYSTDRSDPIDVLPLKLFAVR